MKKSEVFGGFRHCRSSDMCTVLRDGEPWFVAADVCRALEVQNPTQAIGRLDEDERAMLNIGRQGETNIVNEPGLYSLVLGSRKPEARAFKRWITHEVIPAIRKTGSYADPNKPTMDEALKRERMYLWELVPCRKDGLQASAV